MYTIVFSMNFLTAERHLIPRTAKLNRQIYLKVILISNYGSKDMLLWKRGYTFVSTEDENLRIPSRLLWFYGPRSPERLP